MGLRALAGNIVFLARHGVHQTVGKPLAARAWKRRQGPFVHRARHGIRFRLHPGQYIDEQIFTDGIYERRFLEYLARRIRPGGVMLDVGANIGNHALYLKNRFDEIHCFEPNPTVVAALKDNLSLNAAGNVSVHAVGLGSRRGTLPFREVKENLSVSRFTSDEDDEASCRLPIVSGDEWVEENAIGNVSYMKVDVEGFEGEVLKGLQRTIERFQPVISAEFSGHSSGKEETEGVLMGLEGYRLYEPLLEPGNVGPLRKLGFYLANATDPPLVHVKALESRYYPYLLAIPAGRRREFGID